MTYSGADELWVTLQICMHYLKKTNAKTLLFWQSSVAVLCCLQCYLHWVLTPPHLIIFPCLRPGQRTCLCAGITINNKCHLLSWPTVSLDTQHKHIHTHTNTQRESQLSRLHTIRKVGYSICFKWLFFHKTQDS